MRYSDLEAARADTVTREMPRFALSLPYRLSGVIRSNATVVACHVDLRAAGLLMRP